MQRPLARLVIVLLLSGTLIPVEAATLDLGTHPIDFGIGGVGRPGHSLTSLIGSRGDSLLMVRDGQFALSVAGHAIGQGINLSPRWSVDVPASAAGYQFPAAGHGGRGRQDMKVAEVTTFAADATVFGQPNGPAIFAQAFIETRLAAPEGSATRNGKVVHAPEPKTWAMMLAGIGVVVLGLRRRRRTRLFLRSE